MWLAMTSILLTNLIFSVVINSWFLVVLVLSRPLPMRVLYNWMMTFVSPHLHGMGEQTPTLANLD